MILAWFCNGFNVILAWFGVILARSRLFSPRRRPDLSGRPTDTLEHEESDGNNEKVCHFAIKGPNGYVKFEKLVVKSSL